MSRRFIFHRSVHAADLRGGLAVDGPEPEHEEAVLPDRDRGCGRSRATGPPTPGMSRSSMEPRRHSAALPVEGPRPASRWPPGPTAVTRCGAVLGVKRRRGDPRRPPRHRDRGAPASPRAACRTAPRRGDARQSLAAAPDVRHIQIEAARDHEAWMSGREAQGLTIGRISDSQAGEPGSQTRQLLESKTLWQHVERHRTAPNHRGGHSRSS